MLRLVEARGVGSARAGAARHPSRRSPGPRRSRRSCSTRRRPPSPFESSTGSLEPTGVVDEPRREQHRRHEHRGRASRTRAPPPARGPRTHERQRAGSGTAARSRPGSARPSVIATAEQHGAATGRPPQVPVRGEHRRARSSARTGPPTTAARPGRRARSTPPPRRRRSARHARPRGRGRRGRRAPRCRMPGTHDQSRCTRIDSVPSASITLRKSGYSGGCAADSTRT